MTEIPAEIYDMFTAMRRSATQFHNGNITAAFDSLVAESPHETVMRTIIFTLVSLDEHSDPDPNPLIFAGILIRNADIWKDNHAHNTNTTMGEQPGL